MEESFTRVVPQEKLPHAENSSVNNLLTRVYFLGLETNVLSKPTLPQGSVLYKWIPFSTWMKREGIKEVVNVTFLFRKSNSDETQSNPAIWRNIQNKRNKRRVLQRLKARVKYRIFNSSKFPVKGNGYSSLLCCDRMATKYSQDRLRSEKKNKNFFKWVGTELPALLRAYAQAQIQTYASGSASSAILKNGFKCACVNISAPEPARFRSAVTERRQSRQNQKTQVPVWFWTCVERATAVTDKWLWLVFRFHLETPILGAD